MTAKCVNCGLSWNVSILHKIPRTGYTCPHCDGRKKIKGAEKAREVIMFASNK